MNVLVVTFEETSQSTESNAVAAASFRVASLESGAGGCVLNPLLFV